MMKQIGLALTFALGIWFAAPPAASAAPAAGAAIAQAAGKLDNIEHVWFDRFGRWHPNRPFVRAPLYVAPVLPVCRTVQVCNRWGRCWWRRRC
jgi:hypothetical protein